MSVPREWLQAFGCSKSFTIIIIHSMPFSQNTHIRSYEKTLLIQVLEAKNLAKKDIFGASDPYVRIDLVSVFCPKNNLSLKLLFQFFIYVQNSDSIKHDHPRFAFHISVLSTRKNLWTREPLTMLIAF